MTPISTSVAIIGAGPAGLLLGIALERAGVDFVIVERRSQDYILARIRAGVLEQGSVETLTRLGVGRRLAAEGLVHNGIYLQFGGERRHIDFNKLIGRTVTVYGQQEIVRDLMAEHDSLSSAIYYEASEVRPHGIDSASPKVTFDHGDNSYEVSADFIVGADGFHGVSRATIPTDKISHYERDYPYAWLGILANVPPSTDELIYALHEDGFAMHSMRSNSVSRLYLQVDLEDKIENWPDARIWDALHTRLQIPGWTLHEGELTDKSITPMRSFVASRLDYGKMFLIGDAGHIVPPTGAKGLNSAISDVTMLSEALIDHYGGDDKKLNRYGSAALERQWRTQQFSRWMTELLHRQPGPSRSFDFQSQLGQLDYVTRSRFAKEMLAEQYTGLTFHGDARR